MRASLSQSVVSSQGDWLARQKVKHQCCRESSPSSPCGLMCFECKSCSSYKRNEWRGVEDIAFLVVELSWPRIQAQARNPGSKLEYCDSVVSRISELGSVVVLKGASDSQMMMTVCSDVISELLSQLSDPCVLQVFRSPVQDLCV